MLSALAPTACGFRPLHAPQGPQDVSVLSDLAYVTVATVDERNAQLVRNRLVELFSVAGYRVRPVYRLIINVAETEEGLGFQRDDSVTRYNLRFSGQFQLIDERSGESVFAGSSRSIAAYNVVRSDYANLIAQRDARERAARAVAEDIHIQIAVFFRRLRERGGTPS